jgi:outer membrane protein OmpA-like peptidoglycan-associated protein
MKPASQFLLVFALAIVACAGISPVRAASCDYPRQFSTEARMIKAVHPLNTAASLAEETTQIDVVINFPTNSDKLTPVAKKQVRQVAAMLKSSAFQGKHVMVDGYTDSVGKTARNQRLSYHRALRVMHALIAEGVPAGMLSAQGFGKENPIASNTTPDGRAMNRRVSFTVVYPAGM